MTNVSIWGTDKPNGMATGDYVDGITTEPSWVFDNFRRRLGVAVPLIIITVSGLIGNIGTIVAVCLSKKLQTTANAFVVNLSVASSLACATLPFTVANMIHNQETSILPPSVCSFAGVMSYIAFSGTIVAHLLIAIDRVVRITRPNHRYHMIFKRRAVVLMICAAWFYANLSFILGFITHVEYGYSKKYRVCLPDIVDEKTARVSRFRATTIDLFVLVSVFVCYSVIFVYIYRHNKKLLGVHKLSHRILHRTKLETNAPMKTPSDARCAQSGNGTSTATAAPSDGTPVVLRLRELSAADVDFRCKGPSTIGNQSPSDTPTAEAQTSETPLAAIKKISTVSLASLSSLLSRDSVGDIPPRVNDQGRPVRSSAAPTPQNLSLRSQLNARQVKITMNMFLLVAVFAACITPYIICLIIESFERAFPFVAVAYALSNAINPAIYAWKHPQFRSVFKPMVCCRCSDIPEPTRIVKALRDNQQ